ncbi:MAG: hypothetical protein IIC93_01150 [Chloroflexi bacterium]|nr:hypothetical protein [Chloroflexota bacterium]
MAQATGRAPSRSAEVIEKYGRCLELIGIDPNFHDISVGLYLKDGISTVWTFSHKDGVEKRLEEIRDQLVLKGSMEAVAGTTNQAYFACGMFHDRPMRFLLRNAVEKAPISEPDTSPLTVRDIKSKLDMLATPGEEDGQWVYRVSATGEFKRPEIRIRAMVGGFMRYGDLERIEPDTASFQCKARHDALVRTLMPIARNVSGSQDALAAEDMRGQLTTQTLGFSQS